MILRIGKQNRLKSNGLTQPLRTRAGLTFIELVLVTIIILVLVGISTPIFRRPFSGIQLKDACQNLVQLMRYAQAKAIAERRLCRVNFDLEENSFWLTVEDETAPAEFKKIAGKWGKVVKAPEGISINLTRPNEGASLITFYPDGTCDKAEVNLFDVQGKTLLITAKRTISYEEVEK